MRLTGLATLTISTGKNMDAKERDVQEKNTDSIGTASLSLSLNFEEDEHEHEQFH